MRSWFVLSFSGKIQHLISETRVGTLNSSQVERFRLQAGVYKWLPLSLTVQVQIRNMIQRAFVFQRFETILIPRLRAFNKSMWWRKLHVCEIDFVTDLFTILRGHVFYWWRAKLIASLTETRHLFWWRRECRGIDEGHNGNTGSSASWSGRCLRKLRSAPSKSNVKLENPISRLKSELVAQTSGMCFLNLLRWGT